MQRVIAHRTHPATVEVRIVWVSGAVSALTVQPPVRRTADVRGYEDLAPRTLTLSAAGCPDAEIARRLTDEGFRAARGAKSCRVTSPARRTSAGSRRRVFGVAPRRLHDVHVLRPRSGAGEGGRSGTGTGRDHGPRQCTLPRFGWLNADGGRRPPSSLTTTGDPSPTAQAHTAGSRRLTQAAHWQSSPGMCSKPS